MNKAYKFRIYPNDEQKVLFAKTFGCCRFIYNHMLSDKIDHYNKTGKTLKNTPAQYKEEYEFLKEVDSLALANVQLNLQQAYKAFFKKRSKFPKFKSKKHPKRSYTTNNVNNSIRFEDGKLRLPKIELLEIDLHRSVPADWTIKSVTVHQLPTGKYEASVLFEYEKEIVSVEPTSFLGLDYSMSELYVDSDGNHPEYPKFYRKSEKRLAKEQKRLSHMKSGSNNYWKQKRKVAKIHERIANQRKDFLHKQSRQIANAVDCVGVEDLNMQVMSKSLHFGKSVHDNGWGMFTTFLEYKLKEQDKYFIKVDKWYPSSQLCSHCGHKNSDVKDISIREWECPVCGTHHNRDHNAAINIREEVKRIVLASLVA